ncbi:MAG: hypothetical protein ABI135_03215 [Rhodoferax sp.]
MKSLDRKLARIRAGNCELTPHSREHLLSGTADAVLNQDTGHEVRSALRLPLARHSGEPMMAGQERIRIDIYLRGNLP